MRSHLIHGRSHFIYCVTILLGYALTIFPAVETGWITFIFPPVTPETPGEMDFSHSVSGCDSYNPCEVNQVDLFFAQDSLRSPFGILAGGFLDSNLIGPPAPQFPDSLLSSFDSIFFSHQLKAPDTGYGSALPFDPNKAGIVYYVKTGEQHYAAWVHTATYFGGLDRYHFFWVYQNDGSRNLFEPATEVFRKAKKAFQLKLSTSPNPFADRVSIEFDINNFGITGTARISIFNSAGKQIFQSIINPNQPVFTWNAKNQNGVPVPPGTYLVRAWVGNQNAVTHPIIFETIIRPWPGTPPPHLTRYFVIFFL